MKSLGPHKEKNVYLSQEWCSHSVESSAEKREAQLSSLRVKIKKHLDSRAHQLAEKIMKSREEKILETAVEKQVTTFDNATTAVFRTAYYLAKSNRPFTDHKALLELQNLNGVNVGEILHSRFSATSITNHVACEMRTTLVNQIVASSSKLAIIIDESTTLSNKSVLVVYIKAHLGNQEPVLVFLDLIELQSQTSKCVTDSLLRCLKAAGFREEFLQAHWICFVSDGASVMTGRKSGVAQRLCEKYPRLFIWNCLNHRLELAIADALDDVAAINHFKCFMDSLYSLFSQSPKCQRELTEVSADINCQLQKIGRILGVRWIASSYRSVRAVWNCVTALHSYFRQSSDDATREAKQRQKFKGLALRLESPEFLCNLGLLHDVLKELSSLSLFLQKRSTTIPGAELLISRTMRVLSTFKDLPGEKLEEALKSAETGSFGTVILRPNSKVFTINRGQFIQSLVDNISQRLCSQQPANASFLADLNILNVSLWPEQPGIRHGEKEILRLARRFGIDEQEAVNGMRAWVDSHVLERENCKPEDLKALDVCIQTIPCSSVEAERGFSAMNLIVSELRNSLTVENVSSLLMVKINGPPLQFWNPEKYIKTWLLKHRSATDTWSRKMPTSSHDCDDRQFMWSLL